jgi:hypothetical protein
MRAPETGTLSQPSPELGERSIGNANDLPSSRRKLISRPISTGPHLYVGTPTSGSNPARSSSSTRRQHVGAASEAAEGRYGAMSRPIVIIVPIDERVISG